MTYADKLRDRRWLARRNQILDRDDFKCVFCEATEPLDVHHKIYRRGKSPWDYSDDDLETLCRECHGDKEDSIDRIHEAIKDLDVFQMRIMAVAVSDVSFKMTLSDDMAAVLENLRSLKCADDVYAAYDTDFPPE